MRKKDHPSCGRRSSAGSTTTSAFLLTKMLARIDQLGADIAEVEERTTAQIAPFAARGATPGSNPRHRADRRHHHHRRDRGGHDPVPDRRAPVSWAKFSPGIKEFGGRRRATVHRTRQPLPSPGPRRGRRSAAGEPTPSSANATDASPEGAERSEQSSPSAGPSWSFIWPLLNEENARFHDLGPDYYDSRVKTSTRKMRNHVRGLQPPRLPSHPRTRRLTRIKARSRHSHPPTSPLFSD